MYVRMGHTNIHHMNSRLQHIGKKYATLFAAGVFLLMTLLFFFPTLAHHHVPLSTDLVWDYLTGQPSSGKNPLTRDALVQLYPYSDFIFDSYKQWKLPVWNPTIFSGMPFANGQSSAYSPVNILIPFFSDSLSFFTATIVFYFFVAGLGMYLFLHKRIHPVLAVAGGIAWQLSGPMMMWLEWGTIGGVLAFFPLTLYTIRQCVTTKKWQWGIALTVFHYAMLTAGHVQFYLYAVAVSIVYALYLLAQERAAITRRFVMALLSIVIINVSIAAALIHPFIVQSEASHRIHGSNSSFLSAEHLLLWIAPQYWGDPNHFTAQLNYLETAVSVGIIPLIFFFCAVVMPRFWRTSKNHEMPFWGVLAIGILLYNFSPDLIAPLHAVVPMLATVPPFRSLFVLSFLCIVVALHCVEWIRHQAAPQQRRYWLRCIGVCIIAGLYISILAVLHARGFSSPRFVSLAQAGCMSAFMVVLIYLHRRTFLSFVWFACSVVVLCSIDQWITFHDFNPQLSREPLTTPPAYVTAITQRSSNPLIYSEVSPLNIYSLYGIRSIFGYDSTYPQAYYTLIKQHGKIISHRNILNAKIDDVTFLDSLGVDYIVTKRQFDLPVIFDDGTIRVYDMQKEGVY